MLNDSATELAELELIIEGAADEGAADEGAASPRAARRCRLRRMGCKTNGGAVPPSSADGTGGEATASGERERREKGLSFGHDIH
tara:strand:+ start:268 stop:522 length:255 start_codon:yes stop_codon:yes gene_type:complete